MEILANAIKLARRLVCLAIFWGLDALDSHEIVEGEVEIIDEHKFAETVIEEFLEEIFLIIVEVASLDNEFWRATEFVIADSIDNAEVEEEFFEKAFVGVFVGNLFERNTCDWVETMLAEAVVVGYGQVGGISVDIKRFIYELLI